MVSEDRTIPRKREREGESNPSRGCLLDHAASGSSTETASFAAATAFKAKMNGRERPEVAWQRTNFRDASTCADPGFAGTRAPLSMTSLKHFDKTDTTSVFHHLALPRLTVIIINGHYGYHHTTAARGC